MYNDIHVKVTMGQYNHKLVETFTPVFPQKMKAYFIFKGLLGLNCHNFPEG